MTVGDHGPRYGYVGENGERVWLNHERGHLALGIASVWAELDDDNARALGHRLLELTAGTGDPIATGDGVTDDTAAVKAGAPINKGDGLRLTPDGAIPLTCSHPKMFGGLRCVTTGCPNAIAAPDPGPAFDIIQKAEHYNRHPSGIEAIEVIRHMSFNVGNAIKYLWRADLKDAPLQDLKKARYYIDDEISLREKDTPS